jgi:NitT/TauT family transport system substrate-binding protein
MNTLRRRLCSGLAFVLAALAAVAAPAQTKVNIGYVTASDFLPAFVAKEKGIFQKHGIDATLTKIALAPNVAGAIVAGELQIGMSTGPILIQASANGLDLVAVAGVSRFLKASPIASLVARSSEKITSAADLRGKKVGVPGLRSLLHVLFMRWLQLNNVPLNEVQMVETPFPQMKDLLAAGTIDAAIAIEPVRSRILSDKTGVNVSDFTADVNPDILAAFWIAGRDWATKNEAAVKGFRESLVEAIAYAKENPADAQAIQKQYLGFNTPFPPSLSVSFTRADFEFLAKLCLDMNLVRQPVDVDKLILK